MFRYARSILASAFFAIFIVSLALPAPVYAAMSKGEASARAKAQHNGKVMSVDLISSKDGRNTYRVKLLLPDGRVKTVTVSG